MVVLDASNADSQFIIVCDSVDFYTTELRCSKFSLGLQILHFLHSEVQKCKVFSNLIAVKSRSAVFSNLMAVKLEVQSISGFVEDLSVSGN